MMVISAGKTMTMPCQLNPLKFFHIWLIVDLGMRTSDKYPQKHPERLLTKEITKMNINEYIEIEPMIYEDLRGRMAIKIHLHSLQSHLSLFQPAGFKTPACTVYVFRQPL